MIRCFRASRITQAAGWILSVAVATLVFVLRRGNDLWINTIAALLVLALGFVVTRLVANIVATNTNSKLLGILHVEMDPQRFLNAYEQVPKRLKKGGLNHAVACISLADGYAAKGEYALAESMLPQGRLEGISPKLQAAAEVMTLSARTDYALQAGDADHAEAALRNLQDAVERARGVNPTLAANLQNRLKLYQAWLKVLHGGSTDEKALEQMLGHTPVLLQRLEIWLVEANSCLNRGNGQAARKHAEIIQDQAGGTHFAADAKKLSADAVNA